MEDLLSATQKFEENKPIAVLNEGLLRYLDYHERTKVAENIHQLLMLTFINGMHKLNLKNFQNKKFNKKHIFFKKMIHYHIQLLIL